MERAERAEARDAAEPMESTEHTEPMEQIERAEPTEPMERTDPLEAIERRESSDHSESRLGPCPFDATGPQAPSTRCNTLPSVWCISSPPRASTLTTVSDW